VIGATTSWIRQQWLMNLLLLLVVVKSVAGAGSELYVRSWQSGDGLPENIVTGVQQTPDGYLWVATPSGLTRFDGVKFEVYSHTNFPGVPNPFVRALAASRAGGLWLVMDRGPVVALGAGTAQVFNATSLHAQTAVEAEDGTLWIAYHNGGLYRLRGEEVENLTLMDGLPIGGVCSIARNSRGVLWLARGGQLGVWRDERFQPLQTTGSAMTSLASRRTGGVWVCADDRLLICDEDGHLTEQGKFKAVNAGSRLPVLLEDSSGGVWIGTSASGLFHFDGKEFEQVTTTHHEILGLTEDREGNLWVATGGGGLSRIRPRALQLEGGDAGLPFPILQSLCEGSNGTLWAATQNGLLTRRADSRWSLVSSNDGWLGGMVNCVASKPGGAVWIGTREHGVYRWQDGRFSPLEVSKKSNSQDVRGLLVSNAGDVWVGFGGSDKPSRVVLNWRNGDSQEMPLQHMKNIGAMAVDEAGNLWVATVPGDLLRFGKDGLHDETVSARHERLRIRCLHATTDGSLWIGYDGYGLGRLKNGRLGRITVEQGLADNYISQIIQDMNGRYWFGANCGIFSVDQQELEGLLEGRTTFVNSVRHGSDEGFPNLQANVAGSSGALRSQDGRLWMPMRTGLMVINPEQLRESTEPPPALLERVTADGRVAAWYGGAAPIPEQAGDKLVRLGVPDARLRLTPGHKRVVFDFTALSFKSPENVRFRYRLEGMDKDWIEARSQRHSSYSRLPPGDYRFRVAASTDDRIWKEAPTMLEIAATPNVWEMIWFRLAVLLMMLGSVFAAALWMVRLRHGREIERLEQLSVLVRERARIAQDLHDDLGAGLAQIGLLGSIVQRSSVSSERALEHLQQITTTSREMVVALDEIVWAVNPKHDSVTSLSDYFCGYAQEFLQPTPIRCRLDVARELPVNILDARQRHSLFLAFKEALTNVLRHSQATEVCIRISVATGNLLVVVEDNGQGLRTPPASPGADGLANMSRRVTQLGGQCKIEGMPGGGTCVRFILPLGKQ